MVLFPQLASASVGLGCHCTPVGSKLWLVGNGNFDVCAPFSVLLRVSFCELSIPFLEANLYVLYDRSFPDPGGSTLYSIHE